MHVAFCHPDLGLGGAERLVVDAALELQSRGHTVHIYTAHHNPAHSFVETTNGQLPAIRVHGDWIPRHVFGKGFALFASLRCLIVAWAICWSGIQYDAVFVDQVSTVLLLFRLIRPALPTLFYCHFPDLLLSKRGSVLKRMYRFVLDALEQWTTGMAHLILVNSIFTANVFAKTFTKLHQRGIRPQVLYPAVQIPSNEDLINAAESWKKELPESLVSFLTRPNTTSFLSINRFERKKNIDLALHALKCIKEGHQLQLVIAGGFDDRVVENREHWIELHELRRRLELEECIYFIRSITDRQKSLLLAACHAVVYTPQNEHFGIVPLESMSFCTPVIACNSGGPVESIVHGETGWLVEPTPEAFAEAMISDSHEMGFKGRKHVEENFSRSVFGARLETFLQDLVHPKRS